MKLNWKWMTPMLNADGGIGAASGEGVASSEPPSVEAGGEPPVAGSAPAAAPEQEGTPPDVTHQESFASRLKEEKIKIEEKYKPITTHYSQLEQVAKIAGFNDVGEYLTALDHHAQQQHAANEARRLNVDEETYRQYFAPLSDDLNRTKQELQTLKQADSERAVRAEYEQLKAEHSDFETIQDKVFDLAMDRGFTLSEAYKLVSYDEKVNAAKLAGQQEAIQKLQSNSSSATGPVGGDAPGQKFDFAKLPAAERQKYYERAKRGELKSLG